MRAIMARMSGERRRAGRVLVPAKNPPADITFLSPDSGRLARGADSAARVHAVRALLAARTDRDRGVRPGTRNSSISAYALLPSATSPIRIGWSACFMISWALSMENAARAFGYRKALFPVVGP